VSAAPERTPLTDRGRRTREALLSGARSVFEEQGFGATRMNDIATAAGTSHGTVYTYFQTKESVLEAVVQQVIDELLASLQASTAPDPTERVRDANARYLAAYAEHARLLRVVEEAAFSDARFDEVLRQLRSTHTSRVAAAIRRLQAEGAASADLDPAASAAALCAMVEGFARHHRADDHDTLTTLWARALGLSTKE